MPPLAQLLAELTLAELLGIVGFGLYVLNYSLLTLGRVTSHDLRYFAVNGLAASLVLIGLTARFNLAAAMIQGFWIVISIVGILLRLSASRRARLGRRLGV